MRVVLDGNVLIAAFVTRGACAELLEHCIREHEMVASEAILDEVREKLVDKIGIGAADAEAAVKLIRTRFAIVEPAKLGGRVSRDPDDDVIIATAVAGRCQLIVSGDKDLLVLKAHADVRIVSPRGFWSLEGSTRSRS